MNKILIFHLLLAFLGGTKSEQLSANLNNPVRGLIATDEQATSYASIRARDQEKKFGQGHMCGGVLISDKQVLTTAQCLLRSDKTKYQADDLLVVLGLIDQQNSDKKHFESDVDYFQAYPKFNKNTLKNDIAVLFLKSKVPADHTVQPLKLPQTHDPSAKGCIVIGHGVNDWGSDKTDYLRYANVTLIPDADCKKSFPKADSYMFCAEDAINKLDSCVADSGAPLYCTDTIYGIATKRDCKNADLPGIYMKVFAYKSWLVGAEAAYKKELKQRKKKSGANNFKPCSFVYIFLMLFPTLYHGLSEINKLLTNLNHPY